MKQIKLKSLKIINFKGIKDFTADFKHITNFFGQNEAGKTSVMDSFLWTFFGKNSEDKSKFGIKPLDKNNNFIPKVQAEVEAIIQVGTEEISVKKVLKQKWTTRRGDTNEVYSGDENTYFWNEVPLKESEFVKKIEAIIDESLFKLITNPLYFNTNLKWEDRRNILTQMAGEITNEEVFDKVITVANKASFDALIAALNAGKTFAEYQAQITNQKKKLKDEASVIPTRIDEVKRGMPAELNFEEIRNQVANLQAEKQQIETLLSDETAKVNEQNKANAKLQEEHNKAVTEKQQKIFEAKSAMQNIEFEVKQTAKESGSTLDAEIKSVSKKLADKQLDKEKYETSVAGFETELAEKQLFVDAKRTEYTTLDATVLEFNENIFSCPSCKRELEQSDIATKSAELTTNFNTDKKAKLDAIITTANAAKLEVENLQKRIAKGKETIATTTAEIEALQTQLSDLQQQALQPTKSIEDITKELLEINTQYQISKRTLFALENAKLEAPTLTALPTNEVATQKAKELQAQIDELQKELVNEDLITKANARVIELTNQEAKLIQEIAAMEQSENAIAAFNKAKMEAVESKVNDKFKMVTFKMFEAQVNGGEKPCCETLIKGVPFSDANNAAKINAGIDIINALSKYYNVSAPIFIDNRESVAKLIDSDSQIVNLIVSAEDKKLRVA